MFIILGLLNFFCCGFVSSKLPVTEYLKVPPNGVSRVDGATGFLPVETGQKNRPNCSLCFFNVEPVATL